MGVGRISSSAQNAKLYPVIHTFDSIPPMVSVERSEINKKSSVKELGKTETNVLSFFFIISILFKFLWNLGLIATMQGGSCDLQ